MKSQLVSTVAIFGILLAALTSATSAGGAEKKPWWEGTLGYNPEDPIDPKDIERLIENIDHPSGSTRGLMKAIMRITAQKDPRFKDLIGRMDLRKRRDIDMALCAYDYAINGNEKELGRFIGYDSELKLGGDYNTVWIMWMMDEWDRTIESLWRHSAHLDGTAGYTVGSALYCKLKLFPESFAKFRESINTERKVIERLASTVADDPVLDHDHGAFDRFYGHPEGTDPAHHDSVFFRVKELPREGADPLILVSLKKTPRDSPDKKFNFVLEPVISKKDGKRTWKDVTEEMLPDDTYLKMRLMARRKDNVIETTKFIVDESKYNGGSYSSDRGQDLVWDGGKFQVRRPDGERFSRLTRDPYKPSR